ncbi:hypothetical protein GCM10027610_024920 [Dactylosporangium cerinum]
MIGLDRIVGVPLDVMPRRRQQLVEHGRVHLRRVGDHLARHHLQRGQRSTEEPAGRSGVAAYRDEYVDDLAVLIHGAVDVPPDTTNLDVGLIDEPPVAGRVPAEPGCVGQQRREPLHPPEDGDVVDLDTALEEEFFDVAIGQAIPQVPANRDHDHLRREPEPGERRLRC